METTLNTLNYQTELYQRLDTCDDLDQVIDWLADEALRAQGELLTKIQSDQSLFCMTFEPEVDHAQITMQTLYDKIPKEIADIQVEIDGQKLALHSWILIKRSDLFLSLLTETDAKKIQFNQISLIGFLGSIRKIYQLTCLVVEEADGKWNSEIEECEDFLQIDEHLPPVDLEKAKRWTDLQIGSLTAHRSALAMKGIVIHAKEIQTTKINEWKQVLSWAHLDEKRPTVEVLESTLSELDEKCRAISFTRLGILFEKKKSYETAVHFYKKGYDLNHPEAITRLGRMYKNRRGVGQSFQTALRYFRKSSELGDGAGSSNLGVMYEFGKGIKKSHNIPLYLYTKGFQQGNFRSLSNLGDLFEKELLYDLAKECYIKAANRGEVFAIYKLGTMNRSEPEIALYYFLKAAELGDKDAMYEAGNIYLKKGDTKTAKSWFKKSANLGNRDAKRKLEQLKSPRCWTLLRQSF